jgi:hypothetical protein
MAQGPGSIHFTLEPDRNNGSKIHARFRDESRRRGDSDWSTSFVPSDLIGLSPFRASGSRPLHFAVAREPGRLDCVGHGGDGYAAGNCSFTENPAFTQLLVSRGIGRPSREQSFGLTAVNARRELVDAIAANQYPTPTIDNLMALSALQVDGRYIAEMARAGYRPQSLQRLVEFKALDITPQWIAGFARIGYANVPGDGLVQMRALGITPSFIEGFRRIGYPNLPVETLVQLKALDITPQFVSAVTMPGRQMPSTAELVQMKMFGKRR